MVGVCVLSDLLVRDADGEMMADSDRAKVDILEEAFHLIFGLFLEEHGEIDSFFKGTDARRQGERAHLDDMEEVKLGAFVEGEGKGFFGGEGGEFGEIDGDEDLLKARLLVGADEEDGDISMAEDAFGCTAEEDAFDHRSARLTDDKEANVLLLAEGEDLSVRLSATDMDFVDDGATEITKLCVDELLSFVVDGGFKLWGAKGHEVVVLDEQFVDGVKEGEFGAVALCKADGFA
jgi:hypothetical protein